MAHYYQLAKVGRVARRTGILSLIFTISELAILLPIVIDKAPPLDLVIMSIAQLLPGIVVLSLAEKTRVGSPAAFFTIFAVSVLAPIRSAAVMFLSKYTALGIVGFFCDIYTSVPLIWLAWTCNESMGDVRQLIRRRREDQTADHRGFEPVLPSNVPVIVRAARVDAILPSATTGESPVSTSPVVPAPGAKRYAMSHNMHLAVQNARTVAIISTAAAVLLIALNFIIDHKRGYQLLDTSMQYVLLYYVAPAIILVVLAWRMERKDVWPYPVCMALSFGLLARWAISIAIANSMRLQVANFTYFVDSISRWPFIFLAVRSVSALPDAWDLRRQRKREEALNRDRARGIAPTALTLASVIPPPPSGTRGVARSSARDIRG